MVEVSITPSDVNQKYVDPALASYLSYPCSYCLEEFYLVDPQTGIAGGGILRDLWYKNKEVKAVSRVVPVCLQCAKHIVRESRRR